MPRLDPEIYCDQLLGEMNNGCQQKEIRRSNPVEWLWATELLSVSSIGEVFPEYAANKEEEIDPLKMMPNQVLDASRLAEALLNAIPFCCECRHF